MSLPSQTRNGRSGMATGRVLRPLTAASLACLLAAAAPARGEDIPVECPKSPPPAIDTPRSDVYKAVPFKAGEVSTYEVSYIGLTGGYATIEVRPPRKQNGVWQRVFHVEANTTEAIQNIYALHDTVEAVSRPWDFGITSFYMEQNEGKLFHKPQISHKWLEFDHDHCRTHERIEAPDKPEEKADHPLFYGANDSLGVAFNIRTRTFRLGQVERAPVYTSEKNWWLEATPLAFETVTVPAGTFEAVKLKLKTFIGKEMQQQGDVFVWIATKTPERQLLQVQAEIKVGSFWVKLSKYQPGS